MMADEKHTWRRVIRLKGGGPGAAPKEPPWPQDNPSWHRVSGYPERPQPTWPQDNPSWHKAKP